MPNGNATPSTSSGRSLASPDCLVEGRVENSVLFPGVRVAQGALVRDSVVLSGAVIEEGSVVANAVLDEGAHVGPSCYVGYGLSLQHVPFAGLRTAPGQSKDLTVIGRHAIIPRGTAIGQGCVIHPDVAPEDFPSSVVSRHSEVVAQERRPLSMQAAS